VPIQADTIIRDFYKDRKRDKVIRANVVLPDIANFKVTFSTEVPKDLVQETISQCLGFPEDRHDDIVDCIVDSAKLVYKHIPSLLEVL
jgi:phage terminase large subunit-like protein